MTGRRCLAWPAVAAALLLTGLLAGCADTPGPTDGKDVSAASPTGAPIAAAQLPGGPYTLTFDVQKQADGNIAIASSGMRVTGKGGQPVSDLKWKTEPEITLVSGTKVLPVGKMKFG